MKTQMASSVVPLEHNRLLRSLSPGLFGELKRKLRPITLDNGDVLFTAGEKIADIYFLRSGAVSLVIELGSGQMIESAVVGRDSAVGAGAALDDRDSVHKAIVQMPGEALALDAASARDLARTHEEFSRAIMRHEQLILAQAQQSAACNAAHNLRERLARWLLRVRDVMGSDQFPITQDVMAEMLGVGRTSVSLVAHQLQQAGLINYRRGRIKIEQPQALLESACECYDAVKSHYEKAHREHAPPPLADNRLGGDLRADVRGELILDVADLVAQHELALLQALHLDQV